MLQQHDHVLHGYRRVLDVAWQRDRRAPRSTLTKGSPDARAVVAVAAQNDGSNGPFSRAKDPPRRGRTLWS